MIVGEVAAELRMSKSKAYQIVRDLNSELQKKGYLTVAGRMNATFFYKSLLQRLNGKERRGWLYIKTMPLAHGGLSTALGTGKGRGNRHRKEDLRQNGKRWHGNMKACSSREQSWI